MPPHKKAKKGAKHQDDPHRQGNDLRRAYEHMGRLEVLLKSLRSSTAEAVSTLTEIALTEMDGGHNKSAADLLGAAEHHSFAVLAGKAAPAASLSEELKHSITEHFDELLERAEDHWEDHREQISPLAGLYKASRANAVKALQQGAYYPALEFARAAEALAHVRPSGHKSLTGSHKELAANNLQ